MRAFVTTTLVAGLLCVAGCSETPAAAATTTTSAPLPSAPPPEQITAANVDAAADALEKEIANDAE